MDAPTAPDDATLTAAAASFRLSEPKQPSVQRKFKAMADLIDARQFDLLVNETLIKNYAKAKQTGEPTKLGRSRLARWDG